MKREGIMKAFVAFSLAVPPTVMSVAAVAMLLAAAGVTEAQVRYVDGQGQVHWVQAEAQIPEQYRQSATAPQLPSLGQGDATARRVFEGSSRTLDRINAQGRVEDQANAEKRFCNEIL